MAVLLLLSCVIALGVAGSIVVSLYAPGRSAPSPRPVPRASFDAAPAPAPPPMGGVPAPRPPTAPPTVIVEPAPVVLARPVPVARPAPLFAPVVRPHAPLPPLPRTRAARGTGSPRLSPEVTEQVPMLDDFIAEDETSIDDPTLVH